MNVEAVEKPLFSADADKTMARIAPRHLSFPCWELFAVRPLPARAITRHLVPEGLYREGMKYNWRQDKSPANAALSRATLERAAATGHAKALRELAEMMFQGSGGPQNQEHALWLKWSAFTRGDTEALEELSDLKGNGGRVEIVNGVEFWTQGEPEKPYKVIGLITQRRSDETINQLLFAEFNRKQVIEIAKRENGDGAVTVIAYG